MTKTSKVKKVKIAEEILFDAFKKHGVFGDAEESWMIPHGTSQTLHFDKAFAALKELYFSEFPSNPCRKSDWSKLIVESI